ncbi:MAG: exonuclease domain-containing protein [Rhodospirillales bacterium]
MGPRLFLVLCFSALAAASLVSVAVGTLLISTDLPEGAKGFSNIVIVYGGGMAFLLVAVIAMLWAYLDYAIAQPVAAIVRGIQTVTRANPDHRIELDDSHRLGGLPRAVNELIEELAQAKTNVADAIAKATEKIEEQKNRLAVILQDLHEGVIICNLSHHILLYNNRALDILRIAGEIGLDRSLFSFVNRQPILHALSRLTNRVAEGRHLSHAEGVTVAFVGSTIDGRYTLEGRMSLILDSDSLPTGYVISFEDDTEELAALGLRDRLLREATEGLRGPVATLRAAAEILASDSDLTAADETAFKQVMLKESSEVSERLEKLAAQYRDVITGHWPMSDIYSANLFNNLVHRLREQANVNAVMIGIPQWLYGDSYTLVELLDRMIHRVLGLAGTISFELEAVAGERHVYLDILWKGTAIQAAELNTWLDDQLEETLGGLTLRDVLEHHKTDIWSLPHRDGHARLRLPLPPAKQPPTSRDGRARPSRPEFYDFELLRKPGPLGELGARPLRSINYVVFDTETTGLEPSAGDEVIAIGAVRVVNGRILTGESFERLVDPKRPIPKDSIRFHGITDEMIRDKPPIEVVLPQLRRFVGDAVLVAHNAAFDLKFLKLKEAESGVAFEMPVLDTLLLSVYLHDYTTRHTLDAVADRFGIEVKGRHTALGDALVTAGVFLKMIDILEARGIHTLQQAVEASHTIVEVRARQANF